MPGWPLPGRTRGSGNARSLPSPADRPQSQEAWERSVFATSPTAHEPAKLGVDAMAGQMTRDLKTKDDIPLCMRERGYYIRPVD